MKYPLLITLILGMGSNALAGPSISYSGLEEYGLPLYPPASLEFQGALRALTAGARHELLDEVVPYSVIVKNASGRFVLAFTVVYTVKNNEGRPVDHTYSLSTLGKARSRMLAPGQSRLVSPVPFLSDIVNRGQLAGAPALDEESKQYARHRLGMYTNQSTIHVSFDSVVFEDSELIGPDKANTLGKLNSWLRAERELRAIAAKRNAAHLKAYLEEVLSQPERPVGTYSAIDQYDVRRRGLARTFLRELQASEQRLWDLLAAEDGMLISEVHRRAK